MSFFEPKKNTYRNDSDGFVKDVEDFFKLSLFLSVTIIVIGLIGTITAMLIMEAPGLGIIVVCILFYLFSKWTEVDGVENIKAKDSLSVEKETDEPPWWAR